MNLIEHYHLPNFDPESLDNHTIQRSTTHMKENVTAPYQLTETFRIPINYRTLARRKKKRQFIWQNLSGGIKCP